jgi:hypothetical protein
MSRFHVLLASAVMGLFLSAPAFGAGGSNPRSVPEPSDLALFLLGVTGLVIGQRTSRNRRRRNPDDDQT